MAREDIPGYRQATGDKTCGNCGAFEDGYCEMFEASVDSHMVCDDWVSRQVTRRVMEAASPVRDTLRWDIPEPTQRAFEWSPEAVLYTKPVVYRDIAEDGLRRGTWESAEAEAFEKFHRGYEAYYRYDLLPKIANQYGRLVQKHTDKGTLSRDFSDIVKMVKTAFPKDAKNRSYPFENIEKGWERIWHIIDELQQEYSGDDAFWTQLNDLTQHLYDRSMEWLDDAESRAEALASIPRIKDAARDRLEGAYRELGPVAQEVIDWIRANTDGIVTLNELMDEGGFSENRLKKTTEQIRGSVLGEFKGGNTIRLRSL